MAGLGLNWVDLAIIAVLIVFTFEALGRPLILELLDFASFLLAFFLSFSYYNLIGKFFETQVNVPHGLSLVLGFMSVWFISETVFFILVRLILPKIPRLKIPYEGFIAIIPALLRGVIFISLALVLLATFPIQPTIKKSIQNSQIGPLLLKNTYQLEQPVKNVFGGVSEETLTFLTIKPRTDERVDLGFQTNEITVEPATEQAMANFVNRERVSRGLKELAFDPALQAVARSHSADMFKRGYFSHYSPEGQTVADRAISTNTDFNVIGENLAYAPNLDLAHRGLMDSPGHRANILSEDFGRIGIGIYDGGVYGRMFTQVFAD
ncbi:CvpA family protein [Candidatus Daviesbacteria bacterium]|nr:CvpA family protein [Candidatus Daviesbacteria bacterium]